MILPTDIPTRAEIDRLLEHRASSSVDDQTGAVTFAPAPTDDVHDVTDEISRRAWLSGAQVLAVRDDDVPGRGPLAAILRYAL